MSGRVHVDIRAVAALSCFGADRAAHVSALRDGRTGIAEVTAAEFTGLRAAVIPGEDKTPQRPFTLTDRIALQLIESAGLTAGDRKELGVFVGTTTGIAASEEMAFFQQGALGVNKAWTMLCGGPGRVTAHLAQKLASEGPLFTYTTACTSTAVGLIMATHAIRAGTIKRAVVFGLDTLMRISVEGFRLLKLYSPTACRPFDKGRNGLQMGEAAAGVVLEAREGKRSSRFEVLSGALAHDPGHIAAGSSDGATAALVMERSLELAGLTAASVTAIKAHGTGTPVNDLSELRGLERVFGKAPPPFSSLKGIFGHTLGASTALELTAWLWALEDGFIPGNVGFTEAAEGALAPLAKSLPTEGKPGVHLFNSFGFGGTSASFLVEDHGA
jgi:3-oxoacyl-[acyl-carrier-protein] synthase-1